MPKLTMDDQGAEGFGRALLQAGAAEQPSAVAEQELLHALHLSVAIGGGAAWAAAQVLANAATLGSQASAASGGAACGSGVPTLAGAPALASGAGAAGATTSTVGVTGGAIGSSAGVASGAVAVATGTGVGGVTAAGTAGLGVSAAASAAAGASGLGAAGAVAGIGAKVAGFLTVKWLGLAAMGVASGVQGAAMLKTPAPPAPMRTQHALSRRAGPSDTQPRLSRPANDTIDSLVANRTADEVLSEASMPSVQLQVGDAEASLDAQTAPRQGDNSPGVGRPATRRHGKNASINDSLVTTAELVPASAPSRAKTRRRAAGHVARKGRRAGEVATQPYPQTAPVLGEAETAPMSVQARRELQHHRPAKQSKGEAKSGATAKTRSREKMPRHRGFSRFRTSGRVPVRTKQGFHRERMLVDSARGAFSQGRYSDCLVVLQYYERTIKIKQLGLEAIALRVEVLRKVGRHKIADAVARNARRRYIRATDFASLN